MILLEIEYYKGDIILRGKTVPKKELLEQILEVRGVLKRFKVGDLYNFKDKVGIVFEVDDARTSGKIISLKDTISRYGWYVNSGRICRLKHFDFDDGAENMNKIISQKDWYKQYPAFAVCSDYGPEWYLPALNELKTIYENKEINLIECISFYNRLKGFMFKKNIKHALLFEHLLSQD